MAIVFIGQILLSSSTVITFLPEERCYGSEILNVCMNYQKKVIYGKKSVTPFISHYAIIEGEMGLFLTFSVFELHRGYCHTRSNLGISAQLKSCRFSTCKLDHEVVLFSARSTHPPRRPNIGLLISPLFYGMKHFPPLLSCM